MTKPLTKPTRFLILTQFYPPEIGAAQTRLAAMAKELLKTGHEVEIVTAMPNYPTGKIFPEYANRLYRRNTIGSMTIHRFWCFAAQGKGLQRFLNYLSFAAIAIFGIFKAKKPDYIFVNSGPLFLSIPAYIASKIWGVPYIFNVADLWPESIIKMGVIKNPILIDILELFEEWTYKNSYKVTAVTEGIRDTLIKKNKLAKEKVMFLPNGVDVDQFYPREPDMELFEKLNLKEKFVVCYPGNHGNLHALEKVLEAAEVLQNKNEAVVFLFVGGGSEKEKLIQISKSKNLNNVLFIAPQPLDQLARYISVANIGLIHLKNSPLANETRPAKSFPLMAMAKPILYCGFGEGAEVIRNTKSGVVIEPERSELLARAIIQMRRENLEAMGQAGRSFIMANFTWKTNIEKWLNEF